MAPWDRIKRAAGNFGTGLKAFIPTSHGDAARAEVKATFQNFNATSSLPSPVKSTLSFLAPPTSRTEAALALGLSALPIGGVFGKAAAKPAAGAMSKIVLSSGAKTAAVVSSKGGTMLGLGLIRGGLSKLGSVVASSSAKKLLIGGAVVAGGLVLAPRVASAVGNAAASAAGSAGEAVGDGLRRTVEGFFGVPMPVILIALVLVAGTVAYVKMR